MSLVSVDAIFLHLQAAAQRRLVQCGQKIKEFAVARHHQVRLRLHMTTATINVAEGGRRRNFERCGRHSDNLVGLDICRLTGK